MMVSRDPGLSEYLNTVLRQLASWLEQGKVQQIVCVITSEEGDIPLERWVFNIETDKELLLNNQ